MAANIQAITGLVSGGTSIVNAFLVTLQKVNFDTKGDDGVAFLFAYRGEDVANLTSDITDHFTESNSAIQDQIALKPETITLHGYIGELTDQQPGILNTINQFVSRLTVLAPYAPQLTAAALVQFNQAQQIYNAFSTAASTITSAFDLATGSDLQTKQQKAWAYFRDKWKNRALFTVQTPWEMFDDMAILSLQAIQPEDSSTSTEFQITFKKMRFADTQLLTSTISQGRLSAQSADVVNQGFQNPPTTASLGSILGGGTSVQQGIFS